MRTIHPRPGGALVRPVLVLALSGFLALALTEPSSGVGRRTATQGHPAVAAHAHPTLKLNSVGSRYVGAPIPVRGYSWGQPSGKNRLALQRFSTARHRWVTHADKRVRSGPYRFRAVHRRSPGWVKLRTALYVDGRRIAVSNVIKVQVVAQPVPEPAPQPASLRQVPAGAALPDLRIKDLTKCGKGDMDATGGTCFKIDSSSGRKLLRFGVITFNVGAGPGEVVADRSAASATDWNGYQNFYDTSGNLLGSMPDPGVQFYFAGDGHNHWHVRDFDEYDLLDASGSTVAHAEKHGYCMQDNTTYGAMQGQPGVSAQPIYAEPTSCGKGLPNALSIVHGLSRGWGDTYSTSLPDQAIDVTGMADGVYTVRVRADAVGAVRESDEGNNAARVKVQIAGNTVTVVSGTSTGGLP